jgi:hypothetical protein
MGNQHEQQASLADLYNRGNDYLAGINAFLFFTF